MGKKGRKTKEREGAPTHSPVDAALPETEELPHDRFPPVWRVIRWGQLLFGAVFGLLLLRVAQLARAGALGSFGGFLTVLALLAAALIFLVYLQNQHRHGLVPDYSLKCRFCQGPVNRYSEFCEHCGADLIAPEKLLACPRCGAEVYEGTKHCPECGAAIGKGGKPRPRSDEPPPPAEGWDEPLGVGSRLPWER